MYVARKIATGIQWPCAKVVVTGFLFGEIEPQARRR
jgi:hypothetical protein